MSEFKRGDRVRTRTNPDNSMEECTVGLPTDGNGMLVLVRPNGNYWCTGPEKVTLIPETVTVTVELTRDEAEALAVEGRDPGSAAIEDAIGPSSRAYRRLRDAVAALPPRGLGYGSDTP